MKLRSLLLYPIKIIGIKIIFSFFSKKNNNCIYCYSNSTQTFKKLNYYFYPLIIRHCNNCKIYYLNPNLNKKGLGFYYKYLYRIDYLFISRDALFEREYRRGDYIYNYLKQNHIDIVEKKIFEVGAGCGGILNYFKQNYNCHVTGLDLDKETVKYANNKNINLKCSDYINFKTDEKFDIIVLSHVLEHIESLETFFRFIRVISHKNTHVYIEVPGIDNPRVQSRKYSIQPGHLYYFNQKTISAILYNNDFKITNINNTIQLIAKL